MRGFSTLFAAAGIILCGAAFALLGQSGVLITLGTTLLGTLVLVPLDWLPVMALLGTFLLPTEYMPLPHLLVGVPAALPIMAVWVLRTLFTNKTEYRHYRNRFAAVMLAVFAALITISFAFSTVRSTFETMWFATIIVSIATAWLSVSGWYFPSRLFLATFRWMTLALSAFAILEVWFFHSNPLYGSMYAVAQGRSLEVWEVYRATTTLGHPLVNSTMLGAGLVLWVGQFIRNGQRASSVVSTLVSFAGVLATFSRSGLVGSAVGILIVISARGRGDQTLRRFFVAISLVAAGAIALTLLAPRLNSAAGQQSAQNRLNVPTVVAQTIVGHEWIGVGPGMSARYRSDYLVVAGLYSQKKNAQIENAYAETLIGIGVPATVLFIVILGQSVFVGRRRSSTMAATAALGTVIVSVSGYNAFEGHPQILLILFMLMGAITHPDRQEDAEVLEIETHSASSLTT